MHVLVNPLPRLYMTVLKSNPITIVIFGYLAYKSCRFLIKGYFSQGVGYAYYRASAPPLPRSLSLSLSRAHTHTRTHPLIHPQSANHPWNIPAYLDINGSTKGTQFYLKKEWFCFSFFFVFVFVF